MQSPQPEADRISRLLSANERNSNGSQEIVEGDFLKTNQDKHRRLEDEDSSDRRDGQIKGTAYNLLNAELVRKS
jgi:hypothetical protein